MVINMNLEDILNKAIQMDGENKLTKQEIVFLLNQTDESQVDKIYKAACKVRDRNFHKKIFMYGFVYFSTYCRNNCAFCYFRANNDMPPRYRKSINEIVETAVELKKSGIHLIDLTMGEDPYFVSHPEELVEIVKAVKEATGLPIMVSPGVFPDEVIDRLEEAGADWYALYQETHNEKLYSTLRPEQAYEERMHAKMYAKNIGMLVEEGLLTGIGDSKEDAADSFFEMKNIGASQVRTMTFVPQEGTPLADVHPATFRDELLNIAVMRLLFPDKLIPASLDVDGLKGLRARLMAGANVVTSIIPPKEGYAGVANAVADIDEGYRTVAGIQDTLHECGLAAAKPEEYQAWVMQEREAELKTKSERQERLCG